MNAKKGNKNFDATAKIRKEVKIQQKQKHIKMIKFMLNYGMFEREESKK